MSEYLLKMENISKTFPGVKALDDVSFYLKNGEVHALMGENGAGKSTLMKCLFGVYSKDGGKIILEGQEVNFKNSKDALTHGVAMVHQELNQAAVLSVNHNMWLGRFHKVSKYLPFISERKMTDASEKIFDEIGLNVSPTEILGKLSISKRQMLEIAKAISYSAKVIVFDEPTSSLNGEEAERLFSIIDMLKGRGVGIIYISHKMEEILRISDTVTVMRDGKHIATRAAGELTTNEIIKLMVGRELKNRYPVRSCTIGDELMRVEELSGMYTHLRDVSFSLRCGEILGVAGLDGAGRSELLESIFGLSERQGGKIYLSGAEVKNRTPAEAIKNGFALLTEDRRGSGIFGILSICENTVISSLKDYKKYGLISKKKARAVSGEYIKRLRVKAPGMDTKISLLSGGNQQKIIFARWLLTSPTVLLLDEPTRGIDVLAKYEIYELISELAASGKAVIMVSSEMPELMGLCDRILVMSGGRLAGEVMRGASAEEIMELATKYV